MTARDPVSRALDELHGRLAAETGGALADYIPELANVDPGRFGISLCSLQGRVFNAGDTTWRFTIQSVSKPFVYALALADHGLETVLARVGAEPSGEAFNAASLEQGTGRPFNPMINAGAIVTTSLVTASDPAERFERVRTILSAFAGRHLALDEAVYRSEWATGDNNRALGYLMRNAGSLQADLDETLDTYFRQCALKVTTDDLAVMAATLANGGVNPRTLEKVVSPDVASHVPTVMSTCGMYDASGEWLLRVGLPAKSGVSGAVVAVKPGQFGIGLCSPLVDAQGNSVRAVAACRERAERFGLHLLNDFGHPAPSLWLDTTVADYTTGTWRPEDLEKKLRLYGSAVRIRGLQGDIGFAAAERLLESVTVPTKPAEVRRWLILDLERVGSIHPAGQAILEALVADYREAGITTVIADPLERGLIPGVRQFKRLQNALQSCEDALVRDLS